MPTPITAYIGLGANLGDTIGTLLDACDALHALPRSSVFPVFIVVLRWV